MLSVKGAVQFYIISILIILIAGFVSILIYSEISYGILSNQGDSACTLSNAFKNLYTDDDLSEQFLDSGNSNCRPKSETMRAPDITDKNTMFNLCKDLIDFYEGDYELAISDVNFPEYCISYNLMDKSNSCWKTYLKGNAKFSGECNRICLSEGFRSYYLEDSSGEILLPKNSELNLKISNNKISQLKLSLLDLSELNEISDTDIYIDIIEEPEFIKITYQKGNSIEDKDIYLIDIYKLNINENHFSDMNAYYSSLNDFGPEDNLIYDIGNYPNTLNSGDQLVLGFVESGDIDLLEGGITAFSLILTKKIGIAGAFTGSQLGDFFGSRTSLGDIKTSENFIYLDRRGQC